MTNPHHSVHIAPRVEICLQLHPNRISRCHEVIEDAVGHFFVGNRTIAIAIHVKLDRLEFHHPRAGLINQAQHRKIGIPGEGTLASELWKFDRHLIRPAWPWILKADQLGFINRTLAVKGGLSLLSPTGIGQKLNRDQGPLKTRR